MTSRAPSCIESTNLSIAWAQAMVTVFSLTGHARAPLIVSVNNIDTLGVCEEPQIRALLDESLSSLSKTAVRVTAMTIFPYDMWIRRQQPNYAEFAALCVDKLYPRLRALNSANRLGTYFQRMMAYSGEKNGAIESIDQLEFVINQLKNPHRWPRMSALQISFFDPLKDSTSQTRRGFPCLQQIGVTHDGNERITLNAYYPTQSLFDRAYGNYMGLCHLGLYIAHESGLKFERLNCFIGNPQMGNVNKRDIAALVARLEQYCSSRQST